MGLQDERAEALEAKRHRAADLIASLHRVAEACRRPDLDRTSFHEWKRRFRLYGVEGLHERPALIEAESGPEEVQREEVVARIVEAAFQHPGWGSMRIANHLKSQGIAVRPARVQKILARHNLGSKMERLLLLEEKVVAERLQITAEQMRLIEKINPCFRDRHDRTGRPGQLLVQDSCYLGRMGGAGKVYLEAAVDMHGCFAFGHLHGRPQAEEAVTLLYTEVFPFYAEHGLGVDTLLTDGGREFCGDDMHPYELYLGLCDVEHRAVRTRTPYANGFMERFVRTVMEEFVRPLVARAPRDLDEACLRFADWLHRYNYERPLRGYPLLGKCPVDTIHGMARMLRIA
jgi:transposase InsO family protein